MDSTWGLAPTTITKLFPSFVRQKNSCMIKCWHWCRLTVVMLTALSLSTSRAKVFLLTACKISVSLNAGCCVISPSWWGRSVAGLQWGPSGCRNRTWSGCYRRLLRSLPDHHLSNTTITEFRKKSPFLHEVVV